MEEKGGNVFLEEEKWFLLKGEGRKCWLAVFGEESLVLGNLGTGDRGDTLWVWD